MSFASVDGTIAVRSPAQAFFAAFARRIESGIFGVRSRRANYVVTRLAPDALEFRAADWSTAINIGLNEVDLSANGGGSVHYAIRFPRWGSYVFSLSAALAIVLLIVVAVLRLIGPISNAGLAIILAMALFWGIAWPWILIALHKIALRRVIARLIAEVDATTVQARG